MEAHFSWMPCWLQFEKIINAFCAKKSVDAAQVCAGVYFVPTVAKSFNHLKQTATGSSACTHPALPAGPLCL
jgi:hypothetical protein